MPGFRWNRTTLDRDRGAKNPVIIVLLNNQTKKMMLVFFTSDFQRKINFQGLCHVSWFLGKLSFRKKPLWLGLAAWCSIYLIVAGSNLSVKGVNCSHGGTYEIDCVLLVAWLAPNKSDYSRHYQINFSNLSIFSTSWNDLACVSISAVI